MVLEGVWIVEYGPVATEAGLERFLEENVLGFIMVCEGAWVVEYGPVATEVGLE